jgi:hypothetical protein
MEQVLHPPCKYILLFPWFHQLKTVCDVTMETQQAYQSQHTVEQGC